VTNSTSNPDLCWICYRVFTESGTTCEGGAGPGRRRGEEGQGHGSSGVGRRGRSRAEGADRGNTDVGRRGRVGAAPGQCRVLERIGPRSACHGPKDERTPGDAAESAGANHRRLMRILVGNDYFLHNRPIYLLSGNGFCTSACRSIAGDGLIS
jgi:hypothetical protein